MRQRRVASDGEEVPFRLLAELIPQLVWRSLDDGRWDWAGPQWVAFTGQPEVMSHGQGWEDMVHPEDRALTEAAWHAARGRGDLEVEHRLRRADGAYRWFQTRAVPRRDGQGRITHWFGTSTDVDDLRQAEQRALFLSRHDALTGGANRVGLLKVLQEAPDDAPCCLLSLDLDGFKAVNDQIGHLGGDEMLREVAARLQDCLRSDDLLARVGGDEFVLVLRGGDQAMGACVAEGIATRLSTGVTVEGWSKRVEASIGLVLRPRDGRSPEELLRRADLALYRAKNQGGHRLVAFEPSMEADVLEGRALERDLARAMAADAVELFFQPMFEVSTGRLHGFEALSRWTHPERGPIAPDVFIPLAERSRLIVPLGAAMLERACRAAAGWAQGTTVAANLSPVQFREDDVPALVAGVLTRTGLQPAWLELEVTEGLLIEDGTRTRDALEALRRLGVRLVLDDFGTGYSSLSYLCRFAFDKLKVDRAFVTAVDTDPKAHAVLCGAVALGHGLGLQVTAEGVETEAHLAALRGAGCDLAQGFLLGRPMASDKAAALPAHAAVLPLRPGTMGRPDGLYWISNHGAAPEVAAWSRGRWMLLGSVEPPWAGAVTVMNGPLLPPRAVDPI